MILPVVPSWSWVGAASSPSPRARRSLPTAATTLPQGVVPPPVPGGGKGILVWRGRIFAYQLEYWGFGWPLFLVFKFFQCMLGGQGGKVRTSGCHLSVRNVQQHFQQNTAYKYIRKVCTKRSETSAKYAPIAHQKRGLWWSRFWTKGQVKFTLTYVHYSVTHVKQDLTRGETCENTWRVIL